MFASPVNMQERVVMHFEASMLSLLEARAYMYTHSAIKDGWPDNWTEVGAQSYAKIWFSVYSALLLSEESWFANPEHCSSFFLSFVMVSIRTATTYAIWSDGTSRRWEDISNDCSGRAVILYCATEGECSAAFTPAKNLASSYKYLSRICETLKVPVLIEIQLK